jgi:hypothetical protein
MNDEEQWYGRGRSILDQLHAEVRGLQDNFTKYCFQAVSICSVTAGVIFHYMNENPYVGAAAFVLLPIVLITSRMGNNNYASIQRILGYELHLARTLNVPDRFKGRWKEEYRNIKWEEAMRAWRIIQPSLYDKIYVGGRLFVPARYKSGFTPSKHNPLWFCQKSLLGDNKNATWYPGTYLQVIQRILYAIAGIALIIMSLAPFFVLAKERYPVGYMSHEWVNALISLGIAGEGGLRNLYLLCHSLIPGVGSIATSPYPVSPTVEWHAVWHFIMFMFTVVALLVAIVFTFSRFRVDVQRRGAMEDGLLSIHSCAIVWQAVVIAHYEAVELSRRYRLSTPQLAKIVKEAGGGALKKLNEGKAEAVIRDHLAKVKAFSEPDGAGLMGYTFWLGQQASSLVSCAKDVHEWTGLRVLLD